MQEFTARRTADTPGRIVAAAASAGIHARRRRPRRASAARRQRHPGASRPTAAGRSPITAPARSWLTCCSTCGAAALSVRPLVRLMEQAVIDLLAEYGVQARRGASRRPAFTSAAPKIAALGLRIKQRLLLSWARAQRRHGPEPVSRDRSLRLSGARGHADARARHRGLARTCSAKSSLLTCGQRSAQPLEPCTIATRHDTSTSKKAPPRPRAHSANPDPDRAGRAAEEAGLDPRQSRQQRSASRKSSRSCASTSCTRCARRRHAPTSASASAKAPRRS